MALRGKPGARNILGPLIALNFLIVLMVSCGDRQDPAFRTLELQQSDAEIQEESRENSEDAVAESQEKIDVEKLKERAAELGIDVSRLDDFNPNAYQADNRNSSPLNPTGNSNSSGTNSSQDTGAISGTEGTPGGFDSSNGGSSGSNDSSGGDNTAGGSDNTAGGGDNTAGGGDSTAGGGDSTAGGGDSTAGGGDNTAGGGDNTAGGGDNTAGGDDTANNGGSEIPVDYEFHTQDAVQPSPRPVDILWVVDSSGSMAEEQQYLADNFKYLVTSLVNEGANFKTAITSTDICEKSGLFSPECPLDYGGSAETRLQGDFVGTDGEKILDSNDPEIVSKFSRYTKVGIKGSGFEHGLQAAQLAIEKSEDGRNQQLVRDDAFLSIIVVSDEEDDGIGFGMTDGFTGMNYIDEGFTDHRYTHDDLIDYLKNVKGEGNFAISTVTGTKNQDGTLCTSPHSAPREEGSQYINAANATGGTIQSICDLDWSKSLGFIGQDIKSQITQIVLDKTPFAPTIKVYVDDVQTTFWTYVAASNSVKFDVNNVPSPNSRIEITYYAAP